MTHGTPHQPPQEPLRSTAPPAPTHTKGDTSPQSPPEPLRPPSPPALTPVLDELLPLILAVHHEASPESLAAEGGRVIAPAACSGRRSWRVAARASCVSSRWAAAVREWRGGVRRLHLQQATDEELRCVSRWCPRLRELSVDGNLSSHDFHELLQLWPVGPSVSLLLQGQGQPTEVGVKAIVAGCPLLQSLAFENCHALTTRDLVCLRRLELTTLSILDCYMLGGLMEEPTRPAPSPQLEGLASLMAPTRRALRLRACKLDYVAYEPAALAQHQLEELDLQWSEVSGVWLDRVLRTYAELRRLRLGELASGHDLHAVACHCRQLETLELPELSLEEDITTSGGAWEALRQGCPALSKLLVEPSIFVLAAPWIVRLPLQCLVLEDWEGCCMYVQRPLRSTLWLTLQTCQALRSVHTPACTISPDSARALLSQCPLLALTLRVSDRRRGDTWLHRSAPARDSHAGWSPRTRGEIARQFGSRISWSVDKDKPLAGPEE